MRTATLLLCGALVLTTGCPATRHLDLAPASETTGARISEQHVADEGHVFIWRVDGQQVRERDLWRRIDLELDVAPGKHVVECSFSSADIRSTRNAVLPFVADAGGRYVVRARKVKEGFWTELGKGFQSVVVPAKASWVAWIEDASGTVVAGVRPMREGLLRTELPD